MAFYEKSCKNCGGDLTQIGDSQFKCAYCGSVFTGETVEKHMEELRRLFGDSKLEAISNARKNLYDAVNAEYISSQLVHECCMAIKQLIPDDFQANFYETAIGNNGRKIAKAIRKIDVKENYDCVETMIKFLLSSLQSEYILETGDLIDRAYKGTDLVKYEKYSTELSLEAEKLDDCVYMTSYPRDVFVAYSSKDMDKVFELVECLEEQGFSCFVAARNLRHGKGAVENYDKALREAMDNCRSFVFVSSMNSRRPGCDALRKEIPYIKSLDIENAPPAFKKDYTKIPHRYKVHRVEYRLEESTKSMAADRVVSEFFDGYERVYSPEEVADRIMQHSAQCDDDAPESAAPAKQPEKIKYCIFCKAECTEGAKFCSICGGSKFADTIKEAELLLRLEEIENAPKEAPIPESAPKVVKYCIKCKAECSDEVKFCGSCGGSKFANTLAEVELMRRIEELESKPTPAPAPAPKPEPTPSPAPKAEPAPTPPPAPTPKPTTKPAAPAKGTAASKVECANKSEVSDPLSLVHVVIPEGTKMIADNAFEGCSSLRTVHIPDSVYDVGYSVFIGCTSLEEITVSEGNKYYSSVDGCLCDKNGKEFIQYTLGSKSASFTLPKSATIISRAAFAGAPYLKKVTLPDGIVRISTLAFKDCSALTEATLPDSLSRIANDIFDGSAIKTINFAGSQNEWESLISDVEDASNPLKRVRVNYSAGGDDDDIIVTPPTRAPEPASTYTPAPTTSSYDDYEDDGLDFVSGGAGSQGLEYTLNFDDKSYTVKGLENCRDKEIIIPNEYEGKPVTVISAVGFSFVKHKISLIVPDSITKILGFNTFESCMLLTSIKVSSSNKTFKSIDGNLYSKNGSELILYATAKTDSDFTVPSCVKTIADNAFADCDALESISIPASVTFIGENAFDGCSNLERIAFGGTQAEWNAIKGNFREKRAVKEATVTFGNAMPARKSSGSSGSTGSFSGGSSTSGSSTKTSSGSTGSSTGSAGLEYILNDDGKSYTVKGLESCKDKTIIIPEYHDGKPVTTINAIGFAFVRKSVGISIPSTVNKVMGFNTFESFVQPTSIEVSASNPTFKSMGGNLYSKDGKELVLYAIGSTGSSFSIPSGVTTICDNAFCGAKSLNSVSIPTSVTKICTGAFEGCSKLESASFAISRGWRKAGKGTGLDISSTELSDPSKAAKALTGTYNTETIVR